MELFPDTNSHVKSKSREKILSLIWTKAKNKGYLMLSGERPKGLTVLSKIKRDRDRVGDGWEEGKERL